MSELDAAVAAMAKKEYGLFASDALAGVPRGVIRHAVESGRWERLHSGLYAIAGSPDSDEKLLLAGCKATNGIASHRSALWLWGLTGKRLEVVEVSVPRSSSPRPLGVVVHRSRDLGLAVPYTRRGIPVTTPLRTLVDAGAVLPKLLVAQALDAAVAQKLVTASAVEAELRRLARPGRRGAGVLRTVLEERDCIGRSPSVLEARAGRLFARSRVLPPPVPELIAGPNGEFRLDFPWPDALLDIEVDGWEWHSSYAATLLDKRRNNSLTSQGWAFLRYGWQDIVRRPRAVLHEVEAVYVERLTLLGKQMAV